MERKRENRGKYSSMVTKTFPPNVFFQARKLFPAFGKLEASLVHFLALSSLLALSNEGLFELIGRTSLTQAVLSLARAGEDEGARKRTRVDSSYEIPLNSSPSIVVGAKMAPLNSKLAPTFWAVLKCLQIWQMADTGWLRLGGQFRKLL